MSDLQSLEHFFSFPDLKIQINIETIQFKFWGDYY